MIYLIIALGFWIMGAVSGWSVCMFWCEMHKED